MFPDRSDAGRLLAARLVQYKGRPDAIVIALPRGGAVTGAAIANELGLLLDVLIVRKIGFPGQPELAAGAVSENGTVILNRDILSLGGISADDLKPEIERQKQAIARRIALYRGGKKLSDVEKKTVILVDDGVATGATVKAAIAALRQENTAGLVLALPTGPLETVSELKPLVDEFVCLETPFDFVSVSVHYQDFSQVSDEEVVQILRQSAAKAA